MRARRSMMTYSNYSCMHIPVDGPPTRVRVSGSLLALLTYEYPGGYGQNAQNKDNLNTWEYSHASTHVLQRFKPESIQVEGGWHDEKDGDPTASHNEGHKQTKRVDCWDLSNITKPKILTLLKSHKVAR